MTRTKRSVGMAVSIAGLLALAGAPAVADLPAVQSVELANGVRVILAPDPRATSVDLAVWYPAGTITESSGKSGTTNVLSQLMFLGSEHFPRGEHIERMRAEGGNVNSLVHPDYASFFETVPPEALDLAIALEADRMRSLTFRDDDVEALRKGVRAHYGALRASSSLGVALERLNALAFAGHPYAWPVSGREEDLARIVPRDLRAYHRTYFAPDHAIVTVVGDFDPEAALVTLRREFETVPRRAARLGAAPKLPAARPERRATERVGASPMVMVGWRGPGTADADPTALELVAQLLVGGPNARVLSPPLAPGVVARGELDVRRLATLFYCAATIAPGADTAGVEAALIDRVEGLVRAGVTEGDLAHAKKRLEAAVVSAAQTSRGRAQQIGLATVMSGEPLSIDQRLRTIRTTPATAVEKTARALLNPDQRFVVWLNPMSSANGGSEP